MNPATRIPRLLALLILCLGFFPSGSVGQSQKLQKLKRDIMQVIKGNNAQIGVAIRSLTDSTDQLSIHGDQRYPMLSVYKLHVALHMLSKIDAGIFTLDQKIHIPENELLPNTFSKIKEEHPSGALDLSIRQLLAYAICYSDNNACDVLFKLLGGPSAVNAWIKNLGIKEVAIQNTEDQMHKDVRTFYDNWSTPEATNKLLRLFYTQKILSATGTEFLWQLMVRTAVGNDRIRGLLPGGAVTAHRVGTAGLNAAGLNPAFNDVGIVVLPNGQTFAISVFICDSRSSDSQNAKTIADIAKLAADYFAAKKQPVQVAGFNKQASAGRRH